MIRDSTLPAPEAMAEYRPERRDSLRRGVVFGVLWLVSVSGLVSLLLEYRGSNAVEVFGRTYNGADALVSIGVLAIVPVAMLALSIRSFFHYFQAPRGQQ